MLKNLAVSIEEGAGQRAFEHLRKRLERASTEVTGWTCAGKFFFLKVRTALSEPELERVARSSKCITAAYAKA